MPRQLAKNDINHESACFLWKLHILSNIVSLTYWGIGNFRKESLSAIWHSYHQITIGCMTTLWLGSSASANLIARWVPRTTTIKRLSLTYSLICQLADSWKVLFQMESFINRNISIDLIHQRIVFLVQITAWQSTAPHIIASLNDDLTGIPRWK